MINYIWFLCLAALTLVNPSIFGQTWNAGANIPTRVRAGNTATYARNNHHWFFVVSGRDQNDAMTKAVQRYDVGTDTWAFMAPHPTGLLGGATAVLNDSLYVVGGVVNPPGAGLNKVYKYSIAQNTWSQAANFPYAIVDAKAVSYQDSLIYVAGGIGGAGTGNVWLYNGHTNKWRAATPFPAVGNRSFGGFAIRGDTLVYACGTDGFGSSFYSNTVYVGVIDPTNRAKINWIKGADYPGKVRTFFDAHTWRDGIILAGGSMDNTFNTPSKECYYYNTGQNSWSRLPDKPTAWLTGQSGSMLLPNGEWKLICASGYNVNYLAQTEILTAFPNTTTTSEKEHNLSLMQNNPNPFDTHTSIRYTLREKTEVVLSIRDAQGHIIDTLVQSVQAAGTHTTVFDAGHLPAGVYYCHLWTPNGDFVAKMLLAK